MTPRLARHVLLIGLRASGKTTLAQLLAEELGAPWVDLDERTLALLGCATVQQAWEEQGEGAFREAEVQALAEALSAGTPTVVAAGGGSPTAPGAVERIQEAQEQGRLVVLYLRCSPATLRERLQLLGGGGANRPSLTGASTVEEVDAVYQARDGLYRQLADRVVDCDSVAPTVEAHRALAGALARELVEQR